MYLNVPYVAQLGVRKTANDPTGCWQACASMLQRYALETNSGGLHADGTRWDFTKSSDFTLPDRPSASGTRWDFTKGSDFVLSGATGNSALGVGLTALAGGLPLSPDELKRSLRQWGPLIVCWSKSAPQRSTYGHASVVIGISDKREIIYHDPEGAPNSRTSLASFIGKLAPPADRPTLRLDRPARSG